MNDEVANLELEVRILRGYIRKLEEALDIEDTPFWRIYKRGLWIEAMQDAFNENTFEEVKQDGCGILEEVEEAGDHV